MVSQLVSEATSVIYCEEDVSLYFGEVDQGKGTLKINENILEWKGQSKTVMFQYPSISLHAICREISKFPYECIYCLIESEPEQTQAENESDQESAPVSEVRFVPDKKENIQKMYDAITTCQELHPDPDDEYSEDEDIEDNEGIEEGEGMYKELDANAPINLDGFYTANSNFDDIEMSEEGLQILQRLQENLIISSNSNGNSTNDGGNGNQFADAEE